MKKILFVCLGNICRSCTAEEIMRSLIVKNKLEDDFYVDSAGILSVHQGELPDSRMRMHAAKRGYQLEHRSRPVRRDDFLKFDLIVAMDEQNVRDLSRLVPAGSGAEKKIRRMTDFCLRQTADSVPDPYYGGAEGFERVLDILEDACEGLLNDI